MINLIESTKDYWRKLDELEAAYKRGDVSVEEVDVRVAQLMDELGHERRVTLSSIRQSVLRLWQEQRETLLGFAFLAVLTYAWFILN